MTGQAQFYDGAATRTYRFPAAAVDTAAVFGRFIGPAGKLGRVRGIEYLITADITVASSLVTVGNNAAVAPASITLEVAVANLGGSMTTVEEAAAGADEVVGTNDVILDADTVVECASDGGATAGDADVIVTVDWF